MENLPDFKKTPQMEVKFVLDYLSSKLAQKRFVNSYFSISWKGKLF